jgi:hypothetical protein
MSAAVSINLWRDVQGEHLLLAQDLAILLLQAVLVLATHHEDVIGPSQIGGYERGVPAVERPRAGLDDREDGPHGWQPCTLNAMPSSIFRMRHPGADDE